MSKVQVKRFTSEKVNKSKGLYVKRSPSQKVYKSKGLYVKGLQKLRIIYICIYTHKTNINERIIIQKFISVKGLEKLEKHLYWSGGRYRVYII